jgi:hypothetical protein
MNQFENLQNQREQPAIRLASARLQKLMDLIKQQNPEKTFHVTENDHEYVVVVDRKKGKGPETSVIAKTGDEEADEGALFSEIISPLSKDEYLGAEKLGREEEV